jgi:myo-inositol-1(or 4)-monophosphatase
MTELAREGGALLMRYFQQREKVKVEYKGEADLVSIADRECEELLTRGIRQRWPQHEIVAEEGTRASLDSSAATASDYRWYVDPLDGTTNFLHGFPVFCISLGLEYKGKLVAGVIYDPTRDELFSAEKGSGAFLNSRPIRVSSISKLVESLLATGFPSHKRHKNPNIHFYHQLTLRSHGVRRAGSAALDLTCVASGRVDGFWEFNLNPWDTSAGVLLVQEAGGTITDFSGGPFHIESREVLASNGLIHDELIKQFQEIFAGRGLEALASPVEYAKTRGR